MENLDTYRLERLKFNISLTKDTISNVVRYITYAFYVILIYVSIFNVIFNFMSVKNKILVVTISFYSFSFLASGSLIAIFFFTYLKLKYSRYIDILSTISKRKHSTDRMMSTLELRLMVVGFCNLKTWKRTFKVLRKEVVYYTLVLIQLTYSITSLL